MTPESAHPLVDAPAASSAPVSRTRFALWGLLGWLAGLGFQWIATPLDLVEDMAVIVALYAAAIPLIAALTLPLYAYHGLRGADRVVAASFLALPGILLDSVALFLGGVTDPGLSRAEAAGWGSSQLWTYGVLLGTAALFDGRRRPARVR